MHLYSSRWTGISVTALLEAVWLLKRASWLLPSFWGQSFAHSISTKLELEDTRPGSTGWRRAEASGCNTVILVTVERASSRDACGTLPGCLLFCTSLSVHSCLPPPLCPLSALLELEPACVRLWRTVPLSNFRQRDNQRICPNYPSRVTAGALNVRDKTDWVTKSESLKM